MIESVIAFAGKVFDFEIYRFLIENALFGWFQIPFP